MKKKRELIAIAFILLITKGVLNTMGETSLYAPMHAQAMPIKPATAINQMNIKELREALISVDSKIRDFDRKIAHATNSSEKNRLALQRKNLQDERDTYQGTLALIRERNKLKKAS